MKNDIVTFGVGKTDDSYNEFNINAIDYAYCPKCYQPDLEPIAIITICPKCGQLIRWDWMDKFKD